MQARAARRPSPRSASCSATAPSSSATQRAACRPGRWCRRRTGGERAPHAHARVRAARRTRRGDERVAARQGLRHRRRLRAACTCTTARRAERSLSLQADGRPVRAVGRGAEGRRHPRRGRRRDASVAVGARQSAPGGDARDPLRQGLVRGLLRAGVRVAVHGRHRRLRGQAQPDAADLRHAQGHVLRAAHRGAAGAARRALRQRVHAPDGEELREAGRRDHGRAAQRRARLPGRPLARAAWSSASCRASSCCRSCCPSCILAAYCVWRTVAARRPRPLQDRHRGLPAGPGGARGRPGSRSRSAALVEATLLGGELSRLAAVGARAHLRPAQLAGRRRRHGLRRHPDHLHHRRGLARQRAAAPARGLAGARRRRAGRRRCASCCRRRARASSRRS